MDVPEVNLPPVFLVDEVASKVPSRRRLGSVVSISQRAVACIPSYYGVNMLTQTLSVHVEKTPANKHATFCPF